MFYLDFFFLIFFPNKKEEVKTESKTDKRKSVIGRRTPFGLASSSSISASVLSPSSPSAPSTPPCTASTNSLSCSQPLVTRSPSPSPGPLSPSPSPFASQPQLQHTRSISPGMRLTAGKNILYISIYLLLTHPISISSNF